MFNRYFLGLLTLLLASCDVSNKQPPEAAPGPLAKVVLEDGRKSTPSENAAKCPSQDFDLFLKAYIENVEIQKLFTTIPLQSEFIDPSAEPEPKKLTKMLGNNELNFPLMPSLAKQTTDRLKSRRSNLGENEVEVILYKPDTDYQVSFFFRRNDCWKLYRIKDDSL